MVAWVVMNRQQPRQTPPSFSPLPFPFWVSPLPHRRKNYPFVFMHLRGTHFATLLFSNSCMEWGGVPPGVSIAHPLPLFSLTTIVMEGPPFSLHPYQALPKVLSLKRGQEWRAR